MHLTHRERCDSVLRGEPILKLAIKRDFLSTIEHQHHHQYHHHRLHLQASSKFVTIYLSAVANSKLMTVSGPWWSIVSHVGIRHREQTKRKLVHYPPWHESSRKSSTMRLDHHHQLKAVEDRVRVSHLILVTTSQCSVDCCYTAVKQSLNCCYNAVMILIHRCYKFVTLLLHCYSAVDHHRQSRFSTGVIIKRENRS